MKKFLSILMSICMVIGVFSVAPVSVGAAESKAISSGESTDNGLEYWTIYDGTIEITGYTGTATDVTIPSQIGGIAVTSIGKEAFKGCESLKNIKLPSSITIIKDSAFYSCLSLKAITIPNKVTSIGDWAFRNCVSLTEVTIPSSVTTIEDYAFKDCNGLTNITIPDSVEKIGRDAFSDTKWFSSQPNGLVYAGKIAYKYKGEVGKNTSVTIKSGTISISSGAFVNLTGLKGVTIPSSVTDIGSNAFVGCKDLTSISIPQSVTSIGVGSFNGCTSLASINVNSSNKKYSSADGVLFNKDKKVLIRYPEGKKIESYTVPSSVTRIEDDGFYKCANLKNVTVPNSVTQIEFSAFSYCTGLTSISLPSSLEYIEDWTFNNCTSLKDITIPSSVKAIETGAFYCCTALKDITIPNGVTDIEYGTFYNCKSLANIVIPDSVIYISYQSFVGCESLTSITIPEGVKNIGEDAFEGCINLKTVVIPSSVTFIDNRALGYWWDSTAEVYKKIDGFTLKGYTGTTAEKYAKDNELNYVSLGEPVGNDFKYEILNDGNVKITEYVGTEAEVTIPDSIDGHPVTIIGDGAFHYCDTVTSITMGDNVTHIGKYSFASCSKLENIKIGNNVESIDDYAISSCFSLKNITIPKNVTTIGKGAFEYCDSLRNIIVDSENKAYASVDGVLFNKEKTLLIKYPRGREISYYVIPDSVTGIDNSAFKSCRSLITVEVPDGLTTVGDFAFEYCYQLTYITLPDKLTQIGKYAFEYCTNLKSIEIPNSVISIGYCAFDCCEILESINVDSSNKNYSSVDGVLLNKDKTELIKFPTGKKSAKYVVPTTVKNIKSLAFSYCVNMKGIELSRVESIDNNAFHGCEEITQITIPNSLKTIGEQAFEHCVKLNKITLGKGVKTIGDYAFINCKEVKSITIPKNVTAIGDKAFGYYDGYIDCAKKVENFTVLGYEGSTAQKYAKDNGFKFNSIGTKITLAKSAGSVYVKGKVNIKTTVKDGKGKTTFKSSNTKIAKVNSKGVVTGVKKGKAKITVANNGVKKVFNVTVKNPKLNKTSVTIKKGKTFKLKITGKVGKATFKSSDKKIATVNSKGKITGKKKGSATINIKTNGITLKCKVKVK